MLRYQHLCALGEPREVDASTLEALFDDTIPDPIASFLKTFQGVVIPYVIRFRLDGRIELFPEQFILPLEHAPGEVESQPVSAPRWVAFHRMVDALPDYLLPFAYGITADAKLFVDVRSDSSNPVFTPGDDWEVDADWICVAASFAEYLDGLEVDLESAAAVLTGEFATEAHRQRHIRWLDAAVPDWRSIVGFDERAAVEYHGGEEIGPVEP